MMISSHQGKRLARQARLCALAATLLLVLLAAGCANRQDGDPTSKSGDPSSKSGEAAQLINVNGQAGLELDAESLQLAHVTTFMTGTQDLRQTVQPTGEVAPTDSDSVQVTSRLPGKIVQALVSVGSHVSKGQLIAAVDSVDLTQAEATYRTALAHEQLTYNQLLQQRKLAQYGTLSEPALEDARRTFAAAQAAVSSDESQIKVDRITLENTRQLVALGEITHKPVEDAQNAYAQAQSSLTQSQVTLRSTKANLDRAKILFDGGVFSKQQLEDAETAYNTATAAVSQSTTQEKLAAEELRRQESIYKQNLNGASSLQTAQSKLQQDEHSYQNDLTALALARRGLVRAQVVRKSGIPISQALQQAQDAYDEAKVALQGAATTLRLYGIAPGQGAIQMQNGHVVIPVVSPIDGIVIARSMVVGQMTDTSTPLAKVVNLDRVYVDAQVYEKDLTEVAVGDPVQLHVAAFPGKQFTGQVKYIGNEVSLDTRTLMVRTIIRNPGWQLRPGMFATVLIGSRKRQRALAVPADAVLQEGARQVVYVQIAPRQFVKREVKVGTAVGGRLPVYSGLQPGDQVVVNGNVLIEQEQSKLESEKRGAS